jgi:hypothetical protein
MGKGAEAIGAVKREKIPSREGARRICAVEGVC